VKLLMRSSSADAVVLKAQVGEEVDVVVQATGGLEVTSKADGTLKVATDGTQMLLFKIVGKAIGRGEVSVLVFQRGQSIGSVDVAIQIMADTSYSEPTAVTALLQPAPARQPDLQLLVIESGSGAGVSYTMYFWTADPALLNFTPFTFSLQQDPRTFFNAFYADIEDILSSGATAQQKLQRLGAKGTYLFEQLMPPAARATLWGLRSRIHSVHVLSQEPWVPWELIKPSGDNGDGAIVEAGFLCEDYDFTRWVPGLAYRRDLTMNQIGVVIPADSSLPASLPERDAMLALATPQRRVTEIEAEEVSLRKVLAGATLDVVHFTGHGIASMNSADRAEIRLGAGSRLRPEDLTGETANLGKRSPIVFLNACEIGRAGMGLTQPGGWPRGFLSAGAGTFVGPLWKIADGSAAAFASSFYQELIGGASVGAAARTARRSIQAASDPSWLAYSVYAHCDAKLS
jgi:CHAT domain-containing protein